MREAGGNEEGRKRERGGWGKRRGWQRFLKKIDFSSVLVIASFFNGKIDMPENFQKKSWFHEVRE